MELNVSGKGNLFIMKNVMKRVHKLKRIIAWILTIALVSGNVSQLSAVTAYAGESADPESTGTFAEVKVQISKEEIEEVLQNEDFDEMPELDEEMIPFTGSKKEALLGKIYELMDGKILIKQEKVRHGMYLILADNENEDEDLFSRIHLIGINGYTDRDYHFLLQINGDDMAVESAAEVQYQIAGEDEIKAETIIQATPSNSLKTEPAAKGGAESLKDGSKTDEESNGAHEAELEEKAEESSRNDEPVKETDNDPQTDAETEIAAETDAEAEIAEETNKEEKDETVESETDTEKNEASGEEKELTISMNPAAVLGTAMDREEDSHSVNSESEKSDQAEDQEELKEEKSDNEEESVQSENPDKAEEISGLETEREEEIPDQSSSADSDSASGQESTSFSDDSSDKNNTTSERSLSVREKEEEASEEKVFDIITTKEETELSPEDILLLQGIKAQPEDTEKKANVIQRLVLRVEEKASDTYYPMAVESSGLTELSAEVNTDGDIFSQAEALWGENAEQKQRIAEVKLKPEKTGEIEAGEVFSLDISYGLVPSPYYTSALGSSKFYNGVENASVAITVPEQLIISNAGTAVSSGKGTHTYTIMLGNIKESGSGTRELQAYFAGNGKVPIGTEYEMDSATAVTFTGTITIKDPDQNSGKEPKKYTLTDTGQESEEEDPEDTLLSWNIVSPDQWTVTKTIENRKGEPETVKVNGEEKQAVKFVYDLAVGLKINGKIESGEAYYYDKGRAAFKSFSLNDRISFQKTGKDGVEKTVEPLMMTITPYKGNTAITDQTQTVYGESRIKTEYFNQSGYSGGNTEYYAVDEGAPSYTTYKVTVYYPYDEFELDYWDSRNGDDHTFAVNNQADIAYMLSEVGEGTVQTASSDIVSGWYQYTKGYKTITIKKNLKIPVFNSDEYDIIPYDEKNAAYYPGYASFSIQKMNKEGVYEDYPLERIKRPENENGKYVSVDQLAVNPASDEKDGSVGVWGENGSITFYVEPGIYKITEENGPEGTSVVTKPETADVTSNDDLVEFTNEVNTKGGIQFTKFGQEFDDTNTEIKETAAVLKNVEFGIYKEESGTAGTPVMKAVSDDSGIVKFYPLDPGNYIVKELSAPDDYLNGTGEEYRAVVEANKISGLTDVTDNKVVNQANRGTLKVTKYLKNLKSGKYEKLTSVFDDFKSFEKNFNIQKRDGEEWDSVDSLNGLIAEGDSAGTFTKILPVYEKTADGTIAPITYRVVETVPGRYTGETIPGQTIPGQTYEESTSGRHVISDEFTLEDVWKTPGVKEVPIKNIPRGTFGLLKKNVGYSGNQEETVQKLTHSPGAGKKFFLFKKAADGSLEQIPSGSADGGFTADAEGKILAENLDIQDSTGAFIDYYWYEENQGATEILFAYDKAYDQRDKKEKLSSGTITISGNKIENAKLIGPFQLNQQSTVSAYAYNVAQKIPYWIVKKDAVTKNELLWNSDQNDNQQFQFTVYDEAGAVISTVINEGKPFYLETGKQYKIRETYHPGEYSDYIGEHKDNDGYYQIVDLTNAASVDLNSGEIKKETNLVTFENKPKKQFRIDKVSKSEIDGSANNESISAAFDIYIKDGDTFVSSSKEPLQSGVTYYVEPGDYYIKEESIPTGYINPAFYLSGNEGTTAGGVKYVKEGNNVYYGPIAIKTTEKDVVTISIDNVKNKGSIEAVKFDTSLEKEADENSGRIGKNTVIGLYKEKNTAIGDRSERTADSNLTIIKNDTISDSDNGIASFTDLPVYDEDGKKITYVLKEDTPPDGYDLDLTRYEIQLDPGKTVTKLDGKLLAFHDNPLQTLTVYKYWYNVWESKFHKIHNELPGIQLALYVAEPGSPTMTYVKTVVTQEDGSAVFKNDNGKGLDRTKDYYVIEVLGDARYELPEGKIPLALTAGSEPGTLSTAEADISQYNYVKFEALDKSRPETTRMDIIENEQSWVQLNLSKLAKQEITTQEEGNTGSVTVGGKPYYVRDLKEIEKVNGAQFNLYEQENPGNKVLDPDSKGSLIGTYESGTRLDKDGKQIPGEFMTTVLTPGKVYWLEEIKSGPGYSMSDHAELFVFVPDEADGYTVKNGNRKVNVSTYKKNTVTKVEVYNYKNGPGTGGEGTWLAYVKLNKWLETLDDGTGKTIYKPFGGVTFELQIAGKSYATMETGLDNDFSSAVENPTGQAMSRLLDFNEIMEDLKARKTDGTITEDQYNAAIDESNHKIKFDLVEVKAPERVELLKDSYPVTVEFSSEAGFNTEYFYDNVHKTGKQLINRLVKGYPVTVKTWGYKPTDGMFGEGKPLVNDRLLETMDGLGAEPLKGVDMILYKYNVSQDKYEEYKYDGKTSELTAESGSYTFMDGLPKGKYCLVEKNLGSNRWRYYNMYPDSGYSRYFTVEQTQNVVNLYNPELPSVKITKETLSGTTVDVSGISFKLERGTKASRIETIEKGKSSVTFTNIDPGTYTITESGGNANVSVNYLSRFNNVSLTIGCVRAKNAGEVYLKKLDNSVPITSGKEYLAQITMKNPQKSSLTLKKVDGEASEKTLSGAKFKYQRVDFRAEDFTTNGGTTSFKYPDGPVKQEALLAEMKGWTAWSAESSESAATGNDGTVTINNLDPGWYKITETTAPAGYEVSETVHYVAVTGDIVSKDNPGTTDEAFTDKKHVEKLTIKKNLDFGAAIHRLPESAPEAISFELYIGSFENGVFKGSSTGKKAMLTNRDFTASGTAQATISDLRQLTADELARNQSYYLKETVTGSNAGQWQLSGAIQGGESASVESGYIRLNGFTSSSSVEVAITNKYLKADLTIEKTDQSGENRLSGAVFQVYDSKATDGNGMPTGNSLGKFEEKGNGIYQISEIPLTRLEGNTYYIFETQAPQYYVRKAEPIEITLLPGQSLTKDSNQALAVKNESGVDISLTKYADLRENIKDEKSGIQKSDVRFHLYSTTDMDWGAAIWKLEKANVTPEQEETGLLKWKGLSIADGKTYAVYELPITAGKYENYTLDSVYDQSGNKVTAVKAKTEDSSGELRTLHVLGKMTAGFAYGFKAYDRPSQTVTIRKKDYSNTNLKPAAEFAIQKEDGTIVKSGIKTEAVPGKPYSQAVVRLEEGIYRLVETKADSGYSLTPDDVRVIAGRLITIPDKENENTYTFTNMKFANSLNLTKTVLEMNSSDGQDEKLNSLWWNDNQTITYQIAPAAANDSPLTEFTVREEGIVMVDGKGKELNTPGDENNWYTNGKYAIKEIKIPLPEEKSYIKDKDGKEIKLDEIGKITAKVTLEYFQGEKEEITGVVGENLGTDGFWTVKPTKNGMVKAFSISYYDAGLQARTDSKYSLGQEFTPGAIQVKAEIYQQKIQSKTDNRETISKVRNYASTEMKGISYTEAGKEEPFEKSARANVSVDVREPDLPIIQVGLSVYNQTKKSPDGLIEVDDTLQYTMTLKNVSDATIKSPMLNPLFLNRMPKGVEPDLRTVSITVNGEVQADREDIMTVIGSDGYTYLYVPFKGEFKKDNSVEIVFQAEVTKGIINNGNEVRDTLYVTSTLQNAPFTNNYGGATFKVRNQDGWDGWPGLADAGVESAAAQLSLNADSGYASTYVVNTFYTDSNLEILKEGRGNVDEAAGTGYVSNLNSARVTNNGDITYHLIAKNTSDKGVITRLRILDMLPNNVEKENFNGISRGSEWRFDFKPGTIRLYIVSEDDKNSTEINDFRIYYLRDTSQVETGVLKTYKDPGNSWFTDISELKKDERIGTIMVDTGDKIRLKKGEKLVVEYKAEVQNMEADELQKLAYKYSVNDFSAQYYYSNNTDGSNPKMNEFVIHSNSVQAVLIPGRVGVGGHIWIDANGNGIQDDDQYETTEDLKKLISKDYFSVALRSEGEENSRVKAAAGEIGTSLPERDKPEGIINEEGEFLFSGLLPAQPYDESKLYSPVADNGTFNVIRNELNKTSLNGAKPEVHKLSVTTKGEESIQIIPGMILEKSPTTMKGSSSNPEGGKSRMPEDLYTRALYPEERKDNNFIGSGKEYQSEAFFLWSDKTVWDRTKDFGVIPYRNIKVKKTGEAGEPVKGARFIIYGPFAPSETIAPDQNKQIYPSGQNNETDENGSLNGIPKLLYYMRYLIVEDEPAENFVLAGATSNLESYGESTSAWILNAGETNVEIRNNYETGSLTFSKMDESTGKDLAGAEFSISKTEEQDEFTNVGASAEIFAKNMVERSAGEKEAMGITDVRREGGVVYFTTVGKEVHITGIPNGRYVLKEEKAPEHYNSLTDQNSYKFTVKGNSEVTLQSAEENRIYNSRAEFELSWIKKNVYGKVLDGVEFTVEGPGAYDRILGFDRFKKDEDAGIKTVKTDGNGRVQLNVPFGDYRIKETTASGYEALEAFYIRVGKDGGVRLAPEQEDRPYVKFAGEDNDFTVINTPDTGSLIMEKVDSEDDSKKLTGAEFRLTGTSVIQGAWEEFIRDLRVIKGLGIELLPRDESDPEALNFRIIGTDGILGLQNTGMGVIYGLPFGTYRLTETKAPEGYLLGVQPWTAEFTVNESQREVRYTKPNIFTKTNGAIENQPSRITVVKTNAVYADTKLSGAEFILKASDGRYVKLSGDSFAGYAEEEASAGKFVTDSDGQFIIKRLPKDTYTFLETKAPSGYYINKNIPPVTMDGISSFTITIQDVKISGSGSSGGSGGGRSPGGASNGDTTSGPGVVTIIPDQIPLANMPGSGSNELVNIDDGDVPLAGLPKTGDPKNTAGKVLVVLSSFMMALYGALKKKKKEN